MSTQALIEYVGKHHDPQLYCYVLLDPLAIAATSDQTLLGSLRQALGESALTRVWRADLAHSPETLPILACLASPGNSLCQRLLEQTASAAIRDLRRRKRQVCAWLFSSAPAPATAAYLSSMGRIQNSAGAVGFYPLFEPVRFELYAGAFAQADQGHWWPIKHWLFLTSDGAPARVTGEAQPRRPIPANAGDGQEETALIEAVLASWRALRTGPLAQQLTPITRFAATQAAEHIRHARALGLSAVDDILNLVVHQLCLHPALPNHPSVRAMIDSAAQGQRSLGQQFAQYTNANWKHVTTTLPAAEVHS